MLSIMNGYTADDLLQTRLGDLLPIVCRLPLLGGPLLAFDHPGVGWYRFANGAQSWVDAMAAVARRTGTILGCIPRHDRHEFGLHPG